MKTIPLSILLVIATALPAHPLSFQGEMDNRDGALPVPGFTAQSLAWATGGSAGGGLRLEWRADNESTPGLWTYCYRLQRGFARRKGFAFFDVETASDFAPENLKGRSVVSATDRSGLTIPSGLASVEISGPVSFTQTHDFTNAPVSEAGFATALNKRELSHYSGDPGRVPPGAPADGASATSSVGPVAHPFYGVRVTFPGSFTDLAYEAAEWEFCLTADRVPMWGSFFGWGDQTFISPFWYANVYNDNIDRGARLMSPPADSVTGAEPYRGWILVPGGLPRLAAATPADGDTEAPAAVTVAASFTGMIDPATVSASAISVAGVDGSVDSDPADNTLRFVPFLPLAPGTTYSASAGSGVRDLAGHPLPVAAWSFTTTFGPPPSLTGSWRRGGRRPRRRTRSSPCASRSDSIPPPPKRSRTATSRRSGRTGSPGRTAGSRSPTRWPSCRRPSGSSAGEKSTAAIACAAASVRIEAASVLLKSTTVPIVF